MIALLEKASDDGVAWPSLATIAAMTGLRRDHAAQSIRRLVAAGAIRIISLGTGRASSRYFIAPSVPETGAVSVPETGTQGTRFGYPGYPKRVRSVPESGTNRLNTVSVTDPLTEKKAGGFPDPTFPENPSPLEVAYFAFVGSPARRRATDWRKLEGAADSPQAEKRIIAALAEATREGEGIEWVLSRVRSQTWKAEKATATEADDPPLRNMG